jgi:hypothetical protein
MQVSYSLRVVAVRPNQLFRTHKQITFIDQPMVKLIGGISAIGLTGLTYLFVRIRTVRMVVQIHLYRTADILAKLPALVINITIEGHRSGQPPLFRCFRCAWRSGILALYTSQFIYGAAASCCLFVILSRRRRRLAFGANRETLRLRLRVTRWPHCLERNHAHVQSVMTPGIKVRTPIEE